MPEYLAPGVFVEEVSFRQKSIEGVSTSTTGFVGPTRFGPHFADPELLTSFADFERIYGGLDQLEFDGQPARHNFLAHAVRAYFQEGGRRLYVARVFQPLVDDDDPRLDGLRAGEALLEGASWHDGRARWQSATSLPGEIPDVGFTARHQGAAGNVPVTLRFALGDNILTTERVDPLDPRSAEMAVLKGATDGDVVLGLRPGSLPGSVLLPGEVFWAERYFDEAIGRHLFRLRRNNPDQAPDNPAALGDFEQIRVLRAAVTVGAMGRFGEEVVYDELDLHPGTRRFIGTVFDPEPVERRTALYVPLVFRTRFGNGAALVDALLAMPNLNGARVLDFLADSRASDAERSFRVLLAGGNDGRLPDGTDYEGRERNARKSALLAFEDIEDISIVAAPGATFGFRGNSADAVTRFLIAHCERMRYRVAVLDSADGMTPGDVRPIRGSIDSTRAAFYYPWVRVLDPITESEIHLPPSGFIAGIYARNDVERGVQKAPANEVIRLALGLEVLINTAQQEALNPRGINCLRGFEGRGYRVWGARTASSDPEWKYLNVRRYFAFLERSIERGTQWAVFESNGDQLWAKVRRTIEDFLFNEWKENRLLGTKPDLAFFVRCDRTTMSQNDIDNGRLICLIGVAPLRPAEFVIFRIGQKTADARA